MGRALYAGRLVASSKKDARINRPAAGAGICMEACKLSFYGPHPQAAWSFEEHLTLAQQHVSVGNKWVSAAPGWPH